MKARVARAEEEKVAEVLSVPLKWIRPFPDQPRKYFDEEELKNLSESIKTHGQITPAPVIRITDSPNGEKYELVDGQRRYHATGMAGLDRLRVIVRGDIVSKEEQFRQSLMANFGRVGHTPTEIAFAIKRCREQGLKTEEIAAIFVKSVPWVYQHERILKLKPDVLALMSPEIDEKKRLSFSMALLVADMPENHQMATAKLVINRGLKVNEARTLIRREAERVGAKVGRRRTPVDDYKVFQNFLKRTERDATLLIQSGQDFVSGLFEHRSTVDSTSTILAIQRIEDKLETIRNFLRNTQKE